MSGTNKKMELLGSAPIPNALMALGIPIMIGMLINALYNLVDAYFVGGLGAVSYTHLDVYKRQLEGNLRIGKEDI